MKRDPLSEEDIFEAAFALESPDARRDYLQQVCRDDEQAERLQALLEAGAPEASFLEKGPAVLQTDADRPPDLPERIGDFEILGELGRGGMGIVYRARQCSLNRLVALKVLSSGLGLSTRAIMRFKQEAEAAARLHHTNIVPIYWTGEEKRVPYYAMELVDGPSLDRVIKHLRAETDTSRELADAEDSRDQRVPDWIKKTEIFSSPAAGDTAKAADTSSFDSSSSLGSNQSYYDNIAGMMAGVADALAHAHDHGIVHRDIKPANLLLSADGRLSINDFGLARMLEQPGMTMTGELMGSPMYMSPEQITAGRLPLDHRTDIYSLGATLYELLTLQPPFAGQRRDQVLSQVIHKDPPKPRSINPRIPRDLETICLKAMEKDPDRRYQTAELLAEDLRRFVNRHAISARRTGALEKGIRWVRKNKAITAMACLALIVCLSSLGYVYLLQRAHLRDENLEKSIENVMMGKNDEAVSDVENAIAYGADANWKDLILAQQDLFIGHAADALTTLDKVHERAPRNRTARWMLAEAHLSNGEWLEYQELVQDLKQQEPDSPEERLFAGKALTFGDPQRSIALLEGVVKEKPQFAYARVALAMTKVFQAIDTGDGESELVYDALKDLARAKALLEDEENPYLSMARLYAHITIAYLEHIRSGEDDQAKLYLETNCTADMKILNQEKYASFYGGNLMRMYYYQFTRDFNGMYGVMEDIITNQHGGWAADSFWVTCYEDPEWANWDDNWTYSSPLDMFAALPDHNQLKTAKYLLQSISLPKDEFAAIQIENQIEKQKELEAFDQDVLSRITPDQEEEYRNDAQFRVTDDSQLNACIALFRKGRIDRERLLAISENSERFMSFSRFVIAWKLLREGNPDDADTAREILQDESKGTLYHWTTHQWCRAIAARMTQDPPKPPRWALGPSEHAKDQQADRD